MLDPFLVSTDLSIAAFKNINSQLGANYEIISISLYDLPENPLIAVVWAYRANGAPQQIVEFFMKASAPFVAMSATLAGMKSVGFFPSLVSAAGQSGSPASFMVVFEKFAGGVSEPTLVPGMTAQALTGVGTWQYNGYMARSVAAYAGTDGVAFAATFWPPFRTPSFVPWNFILATDGAVLDQHVQVLAETNPAPIRPELLTFYRDATGTRTYCMLWEDFQFNLIVKRDLARTGPQSFGEHRDTYRKEGKYTIRIQASGIGANVRFAASFAPDDDRTQRTFRVIHSTPVPQNPPDPFAAFDNWFLTTMQRSGIRGGQIAVVRQGQLALARAYTWAEPSYPSIRIQDMFRFGSISKPISFLALLQVLQEKAPDALTGTKWNVMDRLGLKAPAGYADVKLAALKISEILNHTSGIVTEWQEQDFQIGVPPVTLPQLMNYVLQQKAVITGTVGQWVYNGFNPILAAWLLEKERWAKAAPFPDNYESLVQGHVFQPLKIGRARIGTSDKRGPGEVLYHMCQPSVGPSHVAADEHLVPGQYGTRPLGLHGPAGGWVMAAVDFARLLAGLHYAYKKTPNPPIASPLNAATAGLMWNYLGLSGSTVTSGGWYRFASSAAGNTLGHNGQVEGGIALMCYRTDGIGLVVTFNGEQCPLKSGNGPDSLYWPDAVALSNLVDAVTAWPAQDQFPNVDANWK